MAVFDLAAKLKLTGVNVVTSGLQKVHKGTTTVTSSFKKMGVTGASLATGSLRLLNNELKALKYGYQQMGRAAAHLRTSLMGVGTIGTGVSIAVGGMVKSAANFDAQMSNVASLLKGGRADESFQHLEGLAKQLGGTTVFTATEAAEGMEIMSKAGFQAQEVMKGLPGVLAAAAAEGISMKKASTAVSGALRGFGLQANEAKDVADALSLISMRTNTNIVEMGDALRYSMNTANQLQMPYQEMIGLLGVAANATLKGSIGGTSLTNMFIKLAGKTKKSAAALRKYGIRLHYSAGEVAKMKNLTAKQKKEMVGQLRPMTKIVQSFSKLFNAHKGLKRLGIMKEIFGIRGQKAAGAFFSQLKDQPDLLEKLNKELYEATDATRKFSFAEQMAERRLNSFKGQLIIFKSAVEGFAIETFAHLTRSSIGGVKSLGKFVRAVTIWSQSLEDIKRKDLLKQLELPKSTILIAREVAAGVKKGIEDIKTGVVDFYYNYIEPIGLKIQKGSGSTTKAITSMSIKVVAALAIIGPATLALIPIMWTLKGAFGAAAVGAKLLFSPFGKWILIGTALINVFAKGQTFTEKFTNSLKWLKETLIGVVGTLKSMTEYLGKIGTIAAIVGGGILLRGAKGLIGGAARKIPGVGKLIGKRGSPVYVTNFEDMGMGLGGIGAGGAAGIGGAAARKGLTTMSLGPVRSFMMRVAGMLPMLLGKAAILSIIGYGAYRIANFFGFGEFGASIGDAVHELRNIKKVLSKNEKRELKKEFAGSTIKDLLKAYKSGTKDIQVINKKGQKEWKLITQELAIELHKKSLKQQGFTGAALLAQLGKHVKLYTQLPTEKRLGEGRRSVQDYFPYTDEKKPAIKKSIHPELYKISMTKLMGNIGKAIVSREFAIEHLTQKLTTLVDPKVGLASKQGEAILKNIKHNEELLQVLREQYAALYNQKMQFNIPIAIDGKQMTEVVIETLRKAGYRHAYLTGKEPPDIPGIKE